MTQCFDRIWTLERAVDKKEKEIQALKRALRSQRAKDLAIAASILAQGLGLVVALVKLYVFMR